MRYSLTATGVAPLPLAGEGPGVRELLTKLCELRERARE